MIFNQDVWDSFGPEIQRMIEVATDKASTEDSTFKYDGESWGREPYIVTRLSPEDEDILREYAWAYWDEQAQANDMAAQVVQIYRDYNAELEEVQFHR
jgi:hypothetical protein